MKLVVETLTRLLGGVIDQLDRLRGRRLSRHHVRPVPVEGNDQLGDAGADPPQRVVAQDDVVAADFVRQRRDAMHLGEQR